MASADWVQSNTFTQDLGEVSDEPLHEADTEEALLSVEPGAYVSHYEIVRLLGQGGMGRVYLARDTKLGRLVAIKLLHTGGQALSRLLAEAQATARVKHENIVVIHEVGVFEGCPYMVLEYLEGRTLRQIISTGQRGEGRRLLPGLVLDIMVSVVQALVAAHAIGIVHRDLKPENIILLDAGRVKVLDFGIAADLLDGGTTSIAGTRAYMSPEQWRGTAADARSDIWSAGILLHELLAGHHPLAPWSQERFRRILDGTESIPKLADVAPRFLAVVDIVDRCLRTAPEDRYGSAKELLEALQACVARVQDGMLPARDLPFAGLAALQEADANSFFGRERDVTAVLGLLERRSLVAVVGASGSGKSSFVRAGLIPALKRSGEEWSTLILRPGRSPISALQELLRTDDFEPDFRTQPARFGARLREFCGMRGPAQRMLVFVDQFEEIHTLEPDADERMAFLRCLLGAADDPSSPARVVIALRSDFLDCGIQDAEWMAHVRAGLFFLPPMSRQSLRLALTEPVARMGFRFEGEEVVEDILTELSRVQEPLPMLQFSAAQLWEARDVERRLLTREAYTNMGGVAGALVSHADAIVAGFSGAEQRLCRAIFLRLVTPERTRAMVYLHEFKALDESVLPVESIVDQLAAARLLIVDTDAEHGTKKVELVHESLITRWPTLSRWLNESAGEVVFLARLRTAAMQWEAQGMASGMLWRDRAAEEARSFYERHLQTSFQELSSRLGALEERYLQAVIEYSERARRRRIRIVAGAFAFVCAVAAVVLVLALRVRSAAQRADEEAARVRQQNAELALQALRGRNVARILAARKHEDDPTLVLAILREIEPPDVPKDWPDLVSAALTQGVSSHQRGFGQPIYNTAISPDGTRVALAMNDGTIPILDARNLHDMRVLRGHEKHVWSLSWSRDGRRLVSASGDSTARIWDVDGNQQPVVLRGHTDGVVSVEFDVTGERILSGGEDGTARIWDARDGHQVAMLCDEDAGVVARFRPDGRQVVTAVLTGHARLWNVETGAEVTAFRGHTGRMRDIAWSPDGTRVVTASADKTVRIWDASDGRELIVLRGHEDEVRTVDWSQDGQRIASSSRDKTARIWNAQGHGNPLVLRGHSHWIYSARFSPDGHQVITSALDASIRQWDLDRIIAPAILRGHEDAISTAQFSPDGKHYATTSFDSTARIWNTDDAVQEMVLRGHTSMVLNLAWSHDGKRLATCSSDNTIRIWSLDPTVPPVVLRGHSARVRTAAWNETDTRIVSGSDDGTVRVWSTDGVELFQMKNQANATYVMFDRTTQRVVGFDADHCEVWAWNVEGQSTRVELGKHDATIDGAMIRADGRFLLTTSKDGTARIWDIQGQNPPTVLREADPIRWAAWSPHGERIAFVLARDRVEVRQTGMAPTAVVPVGRTSMTQIAWMPDGKRIVAAKEGPGARIAYADGHGIPFIFTGSRTTVTMLTVRPDGQRIAINSDEKITTIWPDVRPFSGSDDSRLWTVTSYCVPVPLRVELFGVSNADAEAAFRGCSERVAAAAGAVHTP